MEIDYNEKRNENMKQKVFGIFVLFTLLFMELPGFDITEKTAVILPEKPLKSTVLAADELKAYIKKVSGITLTNDTGKAENFICIGLASDFKEIPASLKKKLAGTNAEDSYILYIKGNKAFFAGKSKTGELFAVYQFLENELGIRFFKPANKMDPGEYVPSKKSSRITIKEQGFVKEPAFRRRLLVLSGWNWIDQPVNGVKWSVKGGFQMRAAYFHPGRIKRKNAEQTALYEPRTQDVWEENDHSFFQRAIPAKKYFKLHPEYFALVNGKRPEADISCTAYCMSNPNVRRLAAEYIIKNIREKKNKGILYIQGTGLSDMGRGWCECQNCIKENGLSEYNWRNITTLYQKTIKAIFDMVYKEIPDAQLTIWAYNVYRKPPAREVKLDPRTHFLYMTLERCYAHSMTSSCHRNDIHKAWLKEYIARNKRVSIYEYFLCSAGRNYTPQELTQAEDIRYFRKAGVTGWEEETFFEDNVSWKRNEKSREGNEKLPSLWQWLYLTGKLLWDPDLDPAALLDDIESKYYGSAYPAMKKYHALRRRLWKENKKCLGYPFNNERLPLLLNTPGSKEELFALLVKVEKLAGKDKILLYRIGLDRKFLVKYWVKANDAYKEHQKKLMAAPAASGKIVIDGKGDEKAWEKAFYTTDFRNIASRSKHAPIPKELAVSCGILSDSKYLYFLIQVKEPLIAKLHKGNNIWERSSIELFLHPQTASDEYYHLAFTLNGEKYEARCPGNIRYEIGAEHKLRKTGDGYTMEIKVPAEMMGDIRNGANWKCNIAINRYVFTDKLIESHYSLGGNLYHDTVRFFPLQVGSPIINGLFNRIVENKRKYYGMKVLKYVPTTWFPSLQQKDKAVYGIKMEPPPYVETLYITRVFANHPLPETLKEGDTLRISFEAKGKGLLDCGIIRFRKDSGKFIKTEYPAKAFSLTEKWQKFSFVYTVKKDEIMRFAFNAFRCEAQVDNVIIAVE